MGFGGHNTEFAEMSNVAPEFESFSGHYKTEEVYRSQYTTRAEGQVGWQLYRIWYETERVHESLGYQTPHGRVTQGALSFGINGGVSSMRPEVGR